MSSEFVLVIACVGVVGLTLIVVVAIICGQWARLRRMQTEAKVRQDMLARGFSADDIIRVETSAAARAVADLPKVNPLAWNLATAIEAMVAADHGTEEIAAVIETFLQQAQTSDEEETPAKDDSYKPDGVRGAESAAVARQ